jgi:hypothetical protein
MSNTQPNHIHLVDFLLQDSSSLKPLFIWGNDKCDVTRSKHPLNPNRELVLKNLCFFTLTLDFEN